MPVYNEKDLRCPICLSTTITNHDHAQEIDEDFPDDKIGLLACNDYDGDSLEIYDTHIEMCTCDNGHMFYLSVEGLAKIDS